jgi:hypothetical protein
LGDEREKAKKERNKGRGEQREKRIMKERKKKTW